jgi:hypothetical protein
MLLGSQGLIHFGLRLKNPRTYQENVLMHARVMSEELLWMDYISTQRPLQRRNTNVWAAVTLNSLSGIYMPAVGRVK